MRPASEAVAATKRLPSNLVDKLKRVWQRFREKGLGEALGYYLKRLGFRVTMFYYTKETLPEKTQTAQTESSLAQHPRSFHSNSAVSQFIDLPDGFEVSTLNLDDVMTISCLPERADYVYKNYVVDNYKKGDICLGLKHRGEIAAFTWFSLDKCHSPLYSAVMAPNEAYLYDMYVKKDYRGKNLAPVLRFKSYEALRGMGRDTFYSITERSNKASFRFKQKLGAQLVFLGFYVEFFGKFRERWVLKRYDQVG